VGNSSLVGNGGVAKWGITGRTVEQLFQNLTNHIQMLSYFTNHNHLQTVLITKTTNIWGVVSHVWVKVARVEIDFVKDRCCGGKWRVGPLKSGELEKKG